MNGHRVLIMDDDVLVRSLLSRVVKGMGHDVTAVGSPRDFMKVCDEFDPTDIFLDVVMPDADATELIQVLARRKSKARVVVMSGYSQYLPMIQRLAGALGMEDVRIMDKPVDLAELRGMLS